MSEETGFFSKPISPAALKVIIITLFGLVLASLALNWYLISQLLAVRNQALNTIQTVKPMAQNALQQADEELASFQNSTLEFNVTIDQELPINVEIPFNESIEIPIDVTIPINQQIETTVMMDPFQAGLEIPVDINVPVDVEVPINMVFPVEIDCTIPISTNVPINLNVPININVADTDLTQYIQQLREGLASLNESLDEIVLPGE